LLLGPVAHECHRNAANQYQAVEFRVVDRSNLIEALIWGLAELRDGDVQVVNDLVGLAVLGTAGLAGDRKYSDAEIGAIELLLPEELELVENPSERWVRDCVGLETGDGTHAHSRYLRPARPAQHATCGNRETDADHECSHRHVPRLAA
jgi:hypothetical protein